MTFVKDNLKIKADLKNKLPQIAVSDNNNKFNSENCKWLVD